MRIKTLAGILSLLVVLLTGISLPGNSAAIPDGGEIGPAIHSSALALTPGGDMLISANPDSNSLTILDLNTLEVQAEVPVCVDPRTVALGASIAYTACRGSDEIAAVDLATGTTISTTQVGRMPYGIVLSSDGTRLYLAEQGGDTLRALDPETLETLGVLPVADRPSGLALSPDGSKLYITHLLQPQLTVVTLQPKRVFLPGIFSPGGVDLLSINKPAAPNSGGGVFEAGLVLTRTIQLLPTSNLLQAILPAPDGSLAYLPHTRSNSQNPNLTFDTTVFPLVSQIDLKSETQILGAQFELGTLDPPGVGLPFDAALTPDSSQLWVVNAASNDLSVIDLSTRALAAHIEVGDNPRAIAISPDGETAFVNNTLAGTLSVIDTATFSLTQTITASQISLPPVMLLGKRLFHSSDDPRMSNAQWIACASCHFDGEHDGRTWNLPFAGPRNTTSLLGMVETYPLRWSGEWNESADSEFAIRRENFGGGLISGDMNCALSPPDCVHQPPNQGLSTELDALAAFIDSLVLPASPGHAHGEPLNAAELRGRELFQNPDLGCVGCHPPPLYTDLLSHDVGTVTSDERIGPSFDTPTLRALYDSAPYFHDGSAPTLYAALTRPSPGGEHDLSALLSAQEMNDLIRYLLTLPYEGN